MNYFDLAQSFIELCESSTRVDDLAAAFGRTLDTLGFRYYACCSHVDPLRPPRRAVMLHNYPVEWIRTYSELQFYDIDPIFLRANQSLLPFSWDDPVFRAELTPPQHEILEEAKRHGIAHGYTIPIHSPGTPDAERGSCSIVPYTQPADAQGCFTVRLMACYLYSAASRDSQKRDPISTQYVLSRRERQCLELAAQGKSDWVAGRLLGISERTVHNHIENAKRRLGVATRVQAIVLALSTRQMSFGDVIRWEPALQCEPGRVRKTS